MTGNDDEFWADRVKRQKQAGSVEDVLATCRANLPYPAAFRELAIALRREIKDAKGQGVDYDAYLQELYELAAYERFLFDSPTVVLSEKAGRSLAGRTYPAFNVAELAHAHGVRRELSFPYPQFGYTHLSLLNKTDVKRLVERWGEPATQRNPREKYAAVWDRFLALFEQKIIAEEAASAAEWATLLGGTQHRQEQVHKKWWWPF